MIKRKVISGRNLPVRLPITFTMTVCLLLDRTHASAVACGVVGTLLVLLWAISVVALFTTQPTDLKELE